MNTAERFNQPTPFEEIRDDKDGYRIDLQASQLPQWISDAKRDAEIAAARREKLEAAERLTGGQQASRLIGGIGSMLKVLHEDALQPENLLEEDTSEHDNWLEKAA